MLNKLKSFVSVSSLMVAAGIIFLAAVILQAYSDQQKYNSPFDQLDLESSEAGLLPIIIYENENQSGEGQNLISGAPTFSVQEVDKLEKLEATAEAQIQIETPEYLQGTRTAPMYESEADTGIDLNPSDESEKGLPPTYISIPAAGVRAPILKASVTTIEYKLQEFQQWVAPDEFAAGWHGTSAALGEVGNTVLTGHHNAYGEVFKDLHTLEQGDLIYLYSGNAVFVYTVGFSTILNERFETVEKRIENATWILPSQDERITLVTCWPYESNTHRVIVVAVPINLEDNSTILD